VSTLGPPGAGNTGESKPDRYRSSGETWEVANSVSVFTAFSLRELNEKHWNSYCRPYVTRSLRAWLNCIPRSLLIVFSSSYVLRACSASHLIRRTHVVLGVVDPQRYASSKTLKWRDLKHPSPSKAALRSLTHPRDVSRTILDYLIMQHLFQLLATGAHLSGQMIIPEGDPAGRPNLATRLEITSSTDVRLFCAKEGDMHQSGYAHFTNALGQEDKHMFWTYVLVCPSFSYRTEVQSRWFKARNAPEKAPVVIFFGGGPGTSGMMSPFNGIGWVQMVPLPRSCPY
jgi:hypothetical protein